jgi:hypothetical protein
LEQRPFDQSPANPDELHLYRNIPGGIRPGDEELIYESTGLKQCLVDVREGFLKKGTTARPEHVRLKEVRDALTLVEQGLLPGAFAEDQITVQQDNFMPGAFQREGLR